MKKVQFSLCAVFAMLCVASVVSVVRADHFSDAQAIDGSYSLHTVYDNNGQYPYNNAAPSTPTYVDIVHSEYVTSYNSWSSQYDDNLSDWSDWSSYATVDETNAINALLSDQYSHLSSLNTAVGDLGSYASDANSQYQNYYHNIILGAKGDNQLAIDALTYISAWQTDINAFVGYRNNAGSYCGTLSSDQSSFESILQGIIDRQ